MKRTFHPGNKGCAVWNAMYGLFLHLWGVYHEGNQSDFEFYATQLDGLQVPFWVQNNIAALAEKRGTIFEQGERAVIETACGLRDGE